MLSLGGIHIVISIISVNYCDNFSAGKRYPRDSFMANHKGLAKVENIENCLQYRHTPLFIHSKKFRSFHSKIFLFILESFAV